VNVSDNTITAATRGISTGKCTDLTMTGNTITGQTAYAFEIGNSQNVTISGNTAHNCATFVNETAAFVNGLVISGNTVTGSGLSSTTTSDTLKLGNGASRVRIIGNLFYDWEYTRSCIRVGDAVVANDVHISDNSFFIVNANTPLFAINLRKSVRAEIRNNTIVVNRDLAAGDDNTHPIQDFLDAASSEHVIEGNTVWYTGTVAAATNAAGISNGNVGASTMTGCRIDSNIVRNGPRGLKFINNSTDLIIVDNNTRTCANADTIPATALIRTQLEYEMSAAPASGTWKVGDRIWNTAPAASGTLGWVCTAAGTPGTWKVFGSIAA
jgi:parallel beta-helix repeat protein